ncbi:MAG TPA: excinuclease ABC subunit UvrA [Syntrophobacteraceae bacterium]|nr:excinuclease ABC subunit UvrA [Syntrophobacteraceae bacterium]
MTDESIYIRGARQNNLKNIDLRIPRNRFVVITGVSGSGKSSLAFDTLFAEGQRRYFEALSSYVRQMAGRLNAPLVDEIDGLSPSIAIEQKGLPHNPRSTVGTLTEIHDYLRLLFARLGTIFCPNCHMPVRGWTVPEILADLSDSLPPKSRILLLAPLGQRVAEKELPNLLKGLRRDGFGRVRADGSVYELDPLPSLPRRPFHIIDIVVDRLVLDGEKPRRLIDSLELALRVGNGTAAIATPEGWEKVYSESARCPSCGYTGPELTPGLFSFLHPSGMCPLCRGLGYAGADEEEASPEGRESRVTSGAYNLEQRHYRTAPRRIADRGSSLTRDAEPATPANAAPRGAGFERPDTPQAAAADAEGPEVPRFSSEPHPCPACNGTRLSETARSVRLGGLSIDRVSAMNPAEAARWLCELDFDESRREILKRPRKEILNRLNSLIELGLPYLTLERASNTLSGGEAQRVRLAHQISSSLSGVLYVLDEPSVGLHPRDHRRLLDILMRLRNAGNSLVVVEHDRETIQCADHLIDMGPGAGTQGGEIVFSGPPEEIAACSASITGLYISGKKKIEFPKRRKKSRDFFRLTGASGHNLKKISVDFPYGCMTCVTGVSGSGKSTLVLDTLYRALARRIYKVETHPARFCSLENAERLRKVILVDQSPIGKTPRSIPATYTGLFGFIRQLFSQVPEARARGYSPARFSFNARGGRCEHCHGEGLQRIEMYFLPDIYVVCPVCQGGRYNRETLDITYRGHSIASILEMTVYEAAAFFANFRPIRYRLDALIDVGMGYIRLGQPATTLSGGEAQRIKLAAELSRRGQGKALYILDEPTTGLHFEDINKLLHVLRKLVDQQNTVIIIEHHPDVIKCADYVIDLGPEGGDGGGLVVAAGAPEVVARSKDSYTAPYLRDALGMP